EVAPKVRRVAVLSNPASPARPLTISNIESAARSLGLQLLVVDASGPGEFDRAFTAMTKQRVEALLLVTDPAFSAHRVRLTCSAPLESSHLSDFVRPEIARAPIAQCLVWALFVVPADPRGQFTPRVVEAGEVVLPDTFFLQAAEEALDDAVLLWRV